jgi:hypothetical protein
MYGKIADPGRSLGGRCLRIGGWFPGFLHSPHYTLSVNRTEKVTKGFPCFYHIGIPKILYGIKALDCGNMQFVPFLRLDDRIRDLLASVKLPRTEKAQLEKAQPLEGRCRQSNYPDGTVYWTFTWSRPEKSAIPPVVPDVLIGNRPAHPEASEIIEDGRPVHEMCGIQHLVAAQDDPAEPKHAA